MKANYYHKIYRAEYHAWLNMQGRCYNPNHSQYKNYGGRKITICDRWREDFLNFLNDVGPRPEGDGTRKGEYSIDRINNNGNYEPSNCKWSTRTEQQKNLLSTQRFTIEGVTKRVKEWSEEFGINYETVLNRMAHGAKTVVELFNARHLTTTRVVGPEVRRRIALGQHKHYLRRNINTQITKVEDSLDIVLTTFDEMIERLENYNGTAK